MRLVSLPGKGPSPPRFVHLYIFAAAFVLSLVLSPSTSSKSLYDPRTSALYTQAAQPQHGPDVRNTIVVPAYREKSNIRALVTTVFHALDDMAAAHTEILIVDDASDDGSEEEVAALKEEGFRVDILVRRAKGERGLSSAVLRGFERARGQKLLVMDADLQVRRGWNLGGGKSSGANDSTASAPRRVRRTAAGRPLRGHSLCHRHTVWQGRKHVKRLAHVPPRYLVGSARPRNPLDVRERPHVWLFRHLERARASKSSFSLWFVGSLLISIRTPYSSFVRNRSTRQGSRSHSSSSSKPPSRATGSSKSRTRSEPARPGRPNSEPKSSSATSASF